MDVQNGSEGGRNMICEVGCIGSWLCVERESEDVTFEVVNINGIVVDQQSFYIVYINILY